MRKLLVIFFALFLSVGFIGFKGNNVKAGAAAAVTSPFWYQFKIDGTLHETGNMEESTSPYWWVNSGAKLILQGGVGKTVQGDLSSTDPWRVLYNQNNPLDTDNGYHPQNIFRLVTRSKWQNFRQEVSFKINKLVLSPTPNRDGYSGILLFNRYVDGDNLYYTGIRQDGKAVIKKKLNGTYYSLAWGTAFTSSKPYDRNTNPNFIPEQKWMGLRSELQNNSDGSVTIKLYVDKANNGTWELVAQAKDDGRTYGRAITEGAYAGIRTDYMDMDFDNYKATNL